jgi:DNA-binding transcriptional regulator LsrR (DeoR family)
MIPMIKQDSSAQSRWELLAQICDMYYIQQQTQLEISKEFHISRVMVSRLLSEAASLGVVEFKINRTSIRRAELEKRLSEAFPEVSFVVIGASSRNVNEVIGRQAAVVAERAVFDGSTLAISYGRAVYETIKAIPVHHFRNLVVVQMAGVEGAANPEVDGWQLVRICAERLGGAYQYLSASLFSSTKEIHTALLADEKIKQIFKIAKNSDLAIVGIGSMDPESSSVIRAGHVSLERFKDAAKAGSVGYIGGQHFNINGQPLSELNSLTMSFDLGSIKDIPEVIGVAHGAEKAKPLLGALRGKYLTSVITDEIAALGILKFLSQNPYMPEEVTPSLRLRNRERTKKRKKTANENEGSSVFNLGKGENVR